MEKTFHFHTLPAVGQFIATLPLKDQAKIDAALEMLEYGEFEVLYIKTLRSPIKELIIRRYRLIFFIEKQTVHLIGGFIKKTAKTPKREIEHAYAVYKMIIK